MKKLLHIIATSRGDKSRTLEISKIFLQSFKKKHPDWVMDVLDVTKEKLPSLNIKQVDGKYVLLDGGELQGEFKNAWDEIVIHIERFLSADAYLVSTPMWNFSIPYYLKQYIDIIIQPKYLFRYTATGVEGLVKNKKMIVVATRGGDYSSGSPSSAYDFQEPYLRAIFGFVGLTDIQFIIAQPMDMGPDIQRSRLDEAKEKAIRAAKEF